MGGETWLPSGKPTRCGGRKGGVNAKSRPKVTTKSHCLRSSRSYVYRRRLVHIQARPSSRLSQLVGRNGIWPICNSDWYFDFSMGDIQARRFQNLDSKEPTTLSPVRRGMGRLRAIISIRLHKIRGNP